MTLDPQKALVLFSGGQDSTTCLAWARPRYAELHTVSFLYGQRHRVELESAARLSALAGAASHKVIDYTYLFSQVTRSPLMETGTDVSGPSAFDSSLPASFVPYRNAFFLTAAAAHAYFLDVRHLVVGICQTDYSGYPDCRPEFVAAFEALANLAHELRTPIQVLLGYLEVLRDEMADALGPRPRQVIDRIHVNAHDLAQTVENVLDFAVALGRGEAEVEQDPLLAGEPARFAEVLQPLRQGGDRQVLAGGYRTAAVQRQVERGTKAEKRDHRSDGHFAVHDHQRARPKVGDAGRRRMRGTRNLLVGVLGSGGGRLGGFDRRHPRGIPPRR